jgi:hypothetical protein
MRQQTLSPLLHPLIFTLDIPGYRCHASSIKKEPLNELTMLTLLSGIS